MRPPIMLILVSFLCSVGFGVVFRIQPKGLLWAGLGGMITRTALIFGMSVTSNRLAFTLFAALTGALYAEFIARKKHAPLAKYLYPSFIPIIPGDLLYQTIINGIMLDVPAFKGYGWDLAQALLALTLGGMLSPMLLHTKAYWKRLWKIKTGKKAGQGSCDPSK